MPGKAIVEGLVSTIIPVFNRGQMLREAVASVLAQTYRPIEVVIVDDGSTDDTPAAIAEICLGAGRLVHAVRRANGGPGSARQSGLEVAQGEFIQFLDSDDLLLPQKFEIQVTLLNSNPAAVAAYGKTRGYRIGEPPRDIAIRRTGEALPALFPFLLRSRWWATSTPLYRASALNRIGPWTSLRNEEDWEYDCRLAALAQPIIACDAFVSDHRSHDGERLSDRGSIAPEKLRDRAEAHRRILQHALGAGVERQTPEMQHFARELFLLARQCGGAGLEREAAMLHGAAIEASDGYRDPKLAIQLSVYGGAARLLGWRLPAKAAQAYDRLRMSRSRPRGSESKAGYLQSPDVVAKTTKFR